MIRGDNFRCTHRACEVRYDGGWPATPGVETIHSFARNSAKIRMEANRGHQARTAKSERECAVLTWRKPVQGHLGAGPARATEAGRRVKARDGRFASGVRRRYSIVDIEPRRSSPLSDDHIQKL